MRSFALLAVASLACVQGTQQAENPVGKVLQLLDSLSAKVIKEGESEQKQYEQFADWCEDVARDKQHEIQNGESKSEDLSAAIEKASADISNFESHIGSLAGSISTNGADLKSATQIREKESTDFSSEHSELVTVVDTLTRAISLLKRGSFVEVSKSKDLVSALQVIVSASVFSTNDRSRLSALIQQSNGASDDSFLEGPTGAPSAKVYEGHSGAIIETLENMLEKAEGMKSDAEKAEANAEHNFAMLRQSLEDQVSFEEKEMDAAKKSKAATEEAKAQAEGDLENTKKGLSEDNKYLDDTQHDCMSKAADWEESQHTRSQELQAIAQAKRAIAELTGSATGRAYAELLQTSSKGDDSIMSVARKLKQMGRQFSDAALVQLAFRAKVAATSSEDPFTKVKGLIQGMIERLVADQQREADHKAYCDKEMSETKAKIEEHTADIDDLTAKVDKASALVSQLDEEITTLQAELAELAKTQVQMDEMRSGEHTEYSESKKDYESGLEGVSMALKILRDYYSADAQAALLQQAPGATHQKASGEASGIIGFLEVIETDFAAKLASTNAAESAAQEWYEKVSQDNKVTKVQKDQDVKYKSQEKKKTEVVIAETKDDRSGVQTELDAVHEYFERLKPTCIAKSEPYAERKKRREAEISGLKEALQILEGEAVAFLQRRN